MCNAYGLLQREGEFLKRFTDKTVGRDCLAFCEALSRISTLEYDIQPRQRSTLPMQIESILNLRLRQGRQILRHWTDQQFDRKSSFPVDYRLNGLGEARHLFHVLTSEKATLISAIAGFLRTHNIYVPTMSIVDPDAKLGEHHLDRLQLASTEIKFGVQNYEDDIAAFVNSGAH